LSDGVNLLLLIGLLEDFFVPLGDYEPRPRTKEARLANLTLAYFLLEEAKCASARARPALLAKGDVRACLRTLYHLFVKHRGQLFQ